MEVNCTEPSPSVRIPWANQHMLGTLNYEERLALQATTAFLAKVESNDSKGFIILY